VMGRVVGVANDGLVVDIYRYLVDPVCAIPRAPTWTRALDPRRSDWYTLDIVQVLQSINTRYCTRICSPTQLTRLESRTDVAISSNRSLPVLSDGAAVISPSGVEYGRAWIYRYYRLSNVQYMRDAMTVSDTLFG
jgi:hypothetical protein